MLLYTRLSSLSAPFSVDFHGFHAPAFDEVNFDTIFTNCLYLFWKLCILIISVYFNIKIKKER